MGGYLYDINEARRQNPGATDEDLLKKMESNYGERTQFLNRDVSDYHPSDVYQMYVDEYNRRASEYVPPERTSAVPESRQELMDQRRATKSTEAPEVKQGPVEAVLGNFADVEGWKTLGKKIAIGGTQVLEGVGYAQKMMELPIEKTLEAVTGEDVSLFGESTMRQASQWGKDIEGTIPDKFKSKEIFQNDPIASIMKLEKPDFSINPEAGVYDVVMELATQVPQYAIGMGTSLMKGVATKIGRTVFPKLGERISGKILNFARKKMVNAGEGAVRKYAEDLVGHSVMQGLVGALQTGTMNAGSTYNEIMDMTLEDLAKKSPEFQQMVASGMSPEDARKSLAMSAANQVFIKTAPSGIPTQLLEFVFPKTFKGNWLTRGAKTASVAAIPEGMQETYEERIQAGEARRGDPSIDPYRNATSAFMLGALGAGIPGAWEGITGKEPTALAKELEYKAPDERVERFISLLEDPEKPIAQGEFNPRLYLPEALKVAVDSRMTVNQAAEMISAHIGINAVRGRTEEETAVLTRLDNVVRNYMKTAEREAGGAIDLATGKVIPKLKETAEYTRSEFLDYVNEVASTEDQDLIYQYELNIKNDMRRNNLTVQNLTEKHIQNYAEQMKIKLVEERAPVQTEEVVPGDQIAEEEMADLQSREVEGASQDENFSVGVPFQGITKEKVAEAVAKHIEEETAAGNTTTLRQLIRKFPQLGQQGVHTAINILADKGYKPLQNPKQLKNWLDLAFISSNEEVRRKGEKARISARNAVSKVETATEPSMVVMEGRRGQVKAAVERALSRGTLTLREAANLPPLQTRKRGMWASSTEEEAKAILQDAGYTVNERGDVLRQGEERLYSTKATYNERTYRAKFLGKKARGRLANYLSTSRGKYPKEFEDAESRTVWVKRDRGKFLYNVYDAQAYRMSPETAKPLSEKVDIRNEPRSPNETRLIIEDFLRQMGLNVEGIAMEGQKPQWSPKVSANFYRLRNMPGTDNLRGLFKQVLTRWVKREGLGYMDLEPYIDRVLDTFPEEMWKYIKTRNEILPLGRNGIMTVHRGGALTPISRKAYLVTAAKWFGIDVKDIISHSSFKVQLKRLLHERRWSRINKEEVTEAWQELISWTIVDIMDDRHRWNLTPEQRDEWVRYITSREFWHEMKSDLDDQRESAIASMIADGRADPDWFKLSYRFIDIIYGLGNADLGTIYHENFHALHMLLYNTPEEARMKRAFMEFIETPFGQSLRHGLERTGYDVENEKFLYMEVMANLFDVMSTPMEMVERAAKYEKIGKVFDEDWGLDSNNVRMQPTEIIYRYILETAGTNPTIQDQRLIRRLIDAIVDAWHRFLNELVGANYRMRSAMRDEYQRFVQLVEATNDFTREARKFFRKPSEDWKLVFGDDIFKEEITLYQKEKQSENPDKQLEDLKSIMDEISKPTDTFDRPFTVFSPGTEGNIVGAYEERGICDQTSYRVVKELEARGYDVKQTELYGRIDPELKPIWHKAALVTLNDGRKFIVDEPQSRLMGLKEFTEDKPSEWFEALAQVTGGTVSGFDGLKTAVLGMSIPPEVLFFGGESSDFGHHEPYFSNSKKILDPSLTKEDLEYAGEDSEWQYIYTGTLEADGKTFEVQYHGNSDSWTARILKGKLITKKKTTFNPYLIPLTKEAIQKEYGAANEKLFEREGENQAGDVILEEDTQEEFTPPVLKGTSKYLAKDQAKSDKANKFIGRGSKTSSTEAYRKSWDATGKANTGVYEESDVVFVSAEGNRKNRLEPDRIEINKALKARATIITDIPADRNRSYNVGEREVAAFLEQSSYVESEPGVWIPSPDIRMVDERVFSQNITGGKPVVDMFLGHFSRDDVEKGEFTLLGESEVIASGNFEFQFLTDTSSDSDSIMVEVSSPDVNLWGEILKFDKATLKKMVKKFERVPLSWAPTPTTLPLDVAKILGRALTEQEVTKWARMERDVAEPELIISKALRARGGTTPDFKSPNFRGNVRIPRTSKVTASDYTKGTPAKTPNIGYFFTENLQAHLNLRGRGAEFTMPSPSELKLNVTATGNQAGIRTDSNGNRYPNTFGIIVKKAQQDAYGKWLAREGQFKDTEADFEMFKKANLEVMAEADATGFPMVFPKQIAMGKSALPRRFATWLLLQIQERYGLTGTIVENKSENYDGFGISNLRSVTSYPTVTWSTGATQSQSVDIVFLPFGTTKPGVIDGHRYKGRDVTNSKPGERGWLGNPYKADDAGGTFTREEATAKFKELIYKKAEEEKDFADALQNLRGKKLGYYQPTFTNHLQAVQDWLKDHPLTQSKNVIEVSSKGDKRFSALYAKLKDGRTIEEAWQIGVKGYSSVKEGKGKPPKRKMSPEESYQAYKNLWRQWARENPKLLKALRSMTRDGKGLNDSFGTTQNNQARALAEILNETNPTDRSNLIAYPKSMTKNEKLATRLLLQRDSNARASVKEILERYKIDPTEANVKASLDIINRKINWLFKLRTEHGYGDVVHIARTALRDIKDIVGKKKSLERITREINALEVTEKAPPTSVASELVDDMLGIENEKEARIAETTAKLDKLMSSVDFVEEQLLEELRKEIAEELWNEMEKAGKTQLLIEDLGATPGQVKAMIQQRVVYDPDRNVYDLATKLDKSEWGEVISYAFSDIYPLVERIRTAEKEDLPGLKEELLRAIEATPLLKQEDVGLTTIVEQEEILNEDGSVKQPRIERTERTKLFTMSVLTDLEVKDKIGIKALAEANTADFEDMQGRYTVYEESTIEEILGKFVRSVIYTAMEQHGVFDASFYSWVADVFNPAFSAHMSGEGGEAFDSPDLVEAYYKIYPEGLDAITRGQEYWAFINHKPRIQLEYKGIISQIPRNNFKYGVKGDTDAIRIWKAQRWEVIKKATKDRLAAEGFGFQELRDEKGRPFTKITENAKFEGLLDTLNGFIERGESAKLMNFILTQKGSTYGTYANLLTMEGEFEAERKAMYDAVFGYINEYRLIENEMALELTSGQLRDVSAALGITPGVGTRMQIITWNSKERDEERGAEIKTNKFPENPFNIDHLFGRLFRSDLGLFSGLSPKARLTVGLMIANMVSSGTTDISTLTSKDYDAAKTLAEFYEDSLENIFSKMSRPVDITVRLNKTLLQTTEGVGLLFSDEVLQKAEQILLDLDVLLAANPSVVPLFPAKDYMAGVRYKYDQYMYANLAPALKTEAKDTVKRFLDLTMGDFSDDQPTYLDIDEDKGVFVETRRYATVKKATKASKTVVEDKAMPYTAWIWDSKTRKFEAKSGIGITMEPDYRTTKTKEFPLPVPFGSIQRLRRPELKGQKGTVRTVAYNYTEELEQAIEREWIASEEYLIDRNGKDVWVRALDLKETDKKVMEYFNTETRKWQSAEYTDPVRKRQYKRPIKQSRYDELYKVRGDEEDIDFMSWVQSAEADIRMTSPRWVTSFDVAPRANARVYAHLKVMEKVKEKADLRRKSPIPFKTLIQSSLKVEFDRLIGERRDKNIEAMAVTIATIRRLLTMVPDITTELQKNQYQAWMINLYEDINLSSSFDIGERTDTSYVDLGWAIKSLIHPKDWGLTPVTEGGIEKLGRLIEIDDSGLGSIVLELNHAAVAGNWENFTYYAKQLVRPEYIAQMKAIAETARRWERKWEIYRSRVPYERLANDLLDLHVDLGRALGYTGEVPDIATLEKEVMQLSKTAKEVKALNAAIRVLDQDTDVYKDAVAKKEELSSTVAKYDKAARILKKLNRELEIVQANQAFVESQRKQVYQEKEYVEPEEDAFYTSLASVDGLNVPLSQSMIEHFITVLQRMFGSMVQIKIVQKEGLSKALLEKTKNMTPEQKSEFIRKQGFNPDNVTIEMLTPFGRERLNMTASTILSMMEISKDVNERTFIETAGHEGMHAFDRLIEFFSIYHQDPLVRDAASKMAETLAQYDSEARARKYGEFLRNVMEGKMVEIPKSVRPLWEKVKEFFQHLYDWVINYRNAYSLESYRTLQKMKKFSFEEILGNLYEGKINKAFEEAKKNGWSQSEFMKFKKDYITRTKYGLIQWSGETAFFKKAARMMRGTPASIHLDSIAEGLLSSPNYEEIRPTLEALQNAAIAAEVDMKDVGLNMAAGLLKEFSAIATVLSSKISMPQETILHMVERLRKIHADMKENPEIYRIKEITRHETIRRQMTQIANNVKNLGGNFNNQLSEAIRQMAHGLPQNLSNRLALALRDADTYILDRGEVIPPDQIEKFSAGLINEVKELRALINTGNKIIQKGDLVEVTMDRLDGKRVKGRHLAASIARTMQNQIKLLSKEFTGEGIFNKIWPKFSRLLFIKGQRVYDTHSQQSDAGIYVWFELFEGPRMRANRDPRLSTVNQLAIYDAAVATNAEWLDPEIKFLVELAREMEEKINQNPELGRRVREITSTMQEIYAQLHEMAVDEGILFQRFIGYQPRRATQTGDVVPGGGSTRAGTSHARHRIHSNLMSFWADGNKLMRTTATGAFQAYVSEIFNVAATKEHLHRVLDFDPTYGTKEQIEAARALQWKDTGMPMWTIDKNPENEISGQKTGEPYVQIPNAYIWAEVGIRIPAVANQPYPQPGPGERIILIPAAESNDRIDQLATLKQVPLYVHPEVWKRIGAAYTTVPSQIKPFLDPFYSLNSLVKKSIFMSSFFHHQAFMREWLIATPDLLKGFVGKNKVLKTLGKDSNIIGRILLPGRIGKVAQLGNMLYEKVMKHAIEVENGADLRQLLMTEEGLDAEMAEMGMVVYKLSSGMASFNQAAEWLEQAEKAENEREIIKTTRSGPFRKTFELFKSIKDKNEDFLFKDFGNGLKVMTGLTAYFHLQSQHAKMMAKGGYIQWKESIKKFKIVRKSAFEPSQELIDFWSTLEAPDRAAAVQKWEDDKMIEMAVDFMISNYGGMNWEKWRRSPNPLVRLWAHPYTVMAQRILMLAPDWTNSQLLTLSKALRPSTNPLERKLYARFPLVTGYIGNLIFRGSVLMLAGNILMDALTQLAKDDDDDDLYPESQYYDNVWKRWEYSWGKPVWKRILELYDIDARMLYLYTAKEGEAERGVQKRWPILGHLTGIFAILTSSARIMKNKLGFYPRLGVSYITGTNFKGEIYTTWNEFVGKDYEKRRFLKSGQLTFQFGPKWGQYKGKITKFGQPHPVQFSQLPSWAVDQSRQALPIQVQEVLNMMWGYSHLFESLPRMFGVGMESDFYPDKEENPTGFYRIAENRLVRTALEVTDWCRKEGYPFNDPDVTKVMNMYFGEIMRLRMEMESQGLSSRNLIESIIEVWASPPSPEDPDYDEGWKRWDDFMFKVQKKLPAKWSME